ncbi:MAG: hypothetical protein IPJ34_09835 [Myxococcales bacterium]|nr:hypothetical protein [Myxococcales bacterium]
MQPRTLASRGGTPGARPLRLALGLGLLGSTLSFSPFLHASEFDVPTGTVRFAPDALRSFGFESLSELTTGSISLVRWKGGTFSSTAELTKADATTLGAMTVTGDAIEGNGALRLTTVTGGIAFADAAFFSSVANQRIEATLWGRGEGVAPGITAVYGKPDGGFGLDYALVPSVRTGRQTSDGWVEYTTGPIDGSIWGVPLRALLIAPSASAPKGTGFLVDALEIRKAPGTVQAANVCSMDDVDTTCGPQGDCLYGHCVSSTVTWGPLPPTAHRLEFADRWTHIAGRLVGDRKSSAFGRTEFATRARDLARYALSSRQFYGGINRLVNELRDNHTSFGGPTSQVTLFSPMVPFGWSAGLHACFGTMEKDLMGGGQVFGVFSAGASPATGVPLKVGDVLVSIDGQDAKTWAEKHMPTLGRTATNDPLGAFSGYADDLAYAITQRANTIKVARCTSSTKCTGDDKKELTIEVASKMYGAITTTGDWPAPDYFGCSPRFTPSVSKLDEGTRGEDTVTAETKDGVVHVQFDGFSGPTVWKDKFTTIFDAKPGKVIMDARQGNGGTGDNVQTMLDLLRGSAEPIGFMTVMNGSWHEPSPTDLFTRYEPCMDGGSGGVWTCFGAWGFFANVAAPAGAGSRIAWLNSIDVSANDYMPKLLQGRTKFRIFAPHPTSGAFGAITSFSSIMPGLSGSSLQFQDSRFGAKFEDLPGLPWESGKGVAPDQVVAQKQSDALDGKDTMLTAARAWLAE